MKNYYKLLILALAASSSSNAQTANRHDIVIDELFPDPAGQTVLPNAEFIELKNISHTSFNLKNWKITDGNSTATINTDIILKPDSFLIVCSNAAVAAYSLIGTTVGVSGFPSLNNDMDLVSLISPEGKIIHTVNYNIDWYHNDIKASGGWSLEMIDPQNACVGYNNWKASENSSRGTPGSANSVDALNKDEQPPALMRTYTIDSVTIMAVFDEQLDGNSAAGVSNYSFDPDIGSPIQANPVSPLFSEVMIKLSAPLSHDKVYTMSVRSVKDCAGNIIGSANKTKAGKNELAESLDIVVNELFFNPPAGGFDYIELYNRSNKIVDLYSIYFANRNSTGNLTNSIRVSSIPYLLFPGEYMAITENSKWLMQNFVLPHEAMMIEILKLHSLPDDKGMVVLTNEQGIVIDEIQYDEKWHFGLIDKKEGVALERIDYNKPTQNKDNWISAAYVVGYGTPGYKNSQFMAVAEIKAAVEVDPKVFSPDNDGYNDLAIIQYQFDEPGYTGSVVVYDANGHTVRYIARQALLGSKGSFRWDGLDEKARELPLGVYIVMIEVFNLKGQLKRFKNALVLARKF